MCISRTHFTQSDRTYVFKIRKGVEIRKKACECKDKSTDSKKGAHERSKEIVNAEYPATTAVFLLRHRLKNITIHAIHTVIR